jgi:hypothetical protein
MLFAFAVQEIKRRGSMMNINLFWQDKGYDHQEIQELYKKGYRISRDLVMRDNARMTLQVLGYNIWATKVQSTGHNAYRLLLGQQFTYNLQMILITQAPAFQHNATPGDNQGANLSRKQSI